GPMFGFSDTWQLIINTGTTIVTFLMVFLIQNTQNRDARALHLKLDEIIRVLDGAENRLMEAEDLQQQDLDQIREDFRKLARKGGTEGLVKAASERQPSQPRQPRPSQG
ncbi:MAG: low affinity iron permease family protein, partial [Armatimonadetes bacterium]|nr:low affinity iron permease family protein [Armatimonadota bacterium]